jgi:hypothetical protein
MTSRSSNPTKLARQATYWRRHGRADVAERLEAALVAAGRCKMCGRTLTDPASLRGGIGPECRRKAGPDETPAIPATLQNPV